MNCNHTRFEHSWGVAHLAEMMVKKLREKQPQLPINDKDVLCIKLAGLFHDLGHGPFSHLYDLVFPAELTRHLDANPDLKKNYEGLPEKPRNWEHEDGSWMMVDAALAHLGLAIDLDNLDKPLKQIGNGVEASSMRLYAHHETAEQGADPNRSDVLTSRDFVFIKECIKCKPINAPDHLFRNSETGFLGRQSRHQEFLFDIVANRWSGLDVDKMDYFARDQRRALGTAGEIQLRVIEEAVVCWADCPKPDKCHRCRCELRQDRRKHVMICFPAKLGEQIMQFFKIRFKLHCEIYKAKKTQAVVYMISDILALADPFFRIPTGSEFGDTASMKNDLPESLPPSRAMLDPNCYLQLTDHVIEQILIAPGLELKPARHLIHRLRCHDLYKCAGQRAIILTEKVDQLIWEKDEIEIRDEMLALGGEYRDENDVPIRLEARDVIVEKCEMHHGAKRRNPMELVRFLSKEAMHALNKPMDELPEAKQLPTENFDGHVPNVPQRQAIRVYCRSSPVKTKLLAHIFQLWKLHNEEQYSGVIYTHDAPPLFADHVPDDGQAKIGFNDFMSPSDQGVYGIRHGMPTSAAPKALLGRLNELQNNGV